MQHTFSMTNSQTKNLRKAYQRSSAHKAGRLARFGRTVNHVLSAIISLFRLCWQTESVQHSRSENLSAVQPELATYNMLRLDR